MKDQEAVKVLDWVREYLDRGYDAIWIYKQALERLDKIGLSQSHYIHFERRVARMTRVNE